MRDRLGDLAAGALLLALAAAVFVVTLGFPPPADPNDPGSAAFPRLVVAGLAVLAVALLARPEEGEPLPRGLPLLRVVGVLVLLFLYATLLEALGFILATGLFTLGALLLAGARNPLSLVLVPPVLGVVLFYVFYELLRVPLPRGLIEGALF